MTNSTFACRLFLAVTCTFGTLSLCAAQGNVSCVGCASLGLTGTLLVVGKTSNSLAFIDMATGTNKGPNGNITITDEPHEVDVSQNDSDTILVVNAAKGKVKGTIDTLGAQTHLVKLASKKLAVATGLFGDVTITIDLKKKEVVDILATGVKSEAIGLSKKGLKANLPKKKKDLRVWVGNREDNLRVLDLGKDLELTEVAMLDGDNITLPIRIAIVINPVTEEEEVWVTQPRVDGVRVYNADAPFDIKEALITTGMRPIGILPIANDKFILVANALGGTISVIDVATKMIVATLSGFTDPDGLTYISGDDDGGDDDDDDGGDDDDGSGSGSGDH